MDEKYRQMQHDLDAIEDIHFDDDAVLSIWLGSLAAYNDGVLLGRWISLPADEDALQKAYDIVTEDGDHDFFIADHQGTYKDVGEYSDPFELNEIVEKLEALDDIEQAVVNWLVKDVGYDIDDVLDEEKYREVNVGDKDDLAAEYMELKFSRDKSTYELFREIYSYIDWDYVWREIECSATTHQHDYNTYFVWWW